jgi:hypothetical protein
VQRSSKCFSAHAHICSPDADSASNDTLLNGRGAFQDVSRCVEAFLAGPGMHLHVRVVAFADEEGLRFQSTFLGSRALAGAPGCARRRHSHNATPAAHRRSERL